jgi:ribose 5-phosphate isomerase B
MIMRIAIACDHAGPKTKELVRHELEVLGHEILDFGTNGTDSVDYPDYAAHVALAVQNGDAEHGVLICGTGIGMSIAANKFAGVRAALCHSEETARLARQHNNANILVLGARVLSETTIRGCVRLFFTTPFEGGRHALRLAKIGG